MSNLFFKLEALRVTITGNIPGATGFENIPIFPKIVYLIDCWRKIMKQVNSRFQQNLFVQMQHDTSA